MIDLQSDPEAYVLSIPAMGSMIDLRWISNAQSASKDPVKLGEDLQAEIDRWVEVMSDYQQDSQVNQLCRQADDGKWHSPSTELWRVLMLCDDWNRWSQGAFDASVGALTRLRRSKNIATKDHWEQATQSCGWELIQWDRAGGRLRFKRPGIRLDFGAIGKGFVVDRLAEHLQSIGIESYSVNASGNMVFGKSPAPTVRGWPVSIGLVDQPDRSLLSVRLSQCGIATSGDLHQKYRDRPGVNADQDKSSHIVDPAQQKGLAGSIMATVITSDATNADAFATSCCVHAARGTLRTWLSDLETSTDGYQGTFEIWVQTAVTANESPRLLHWR